MENLVWRRKNLAEIKARYEGKYSDYSVTVDDEANLIITWSKSRLYVVGEEIPDDEPAGV